jgi:hypothetical protein
MSELTPLDRAVQALVDHDRETERRAWERWKLLEAIWAEAKALGYHPHIDGDPLIFRCGSVIVETPHERSLTWKVIEPLRAREPDPEPEIPY